MTVPQSPGEITFGNKNEVVSNQIGVNTFLIRGKVINGKGKIKLL